ncbi:MCE family protein [Mycolicibacterium sp. 3033]|nr:MCE family protein [Mycolicibacterium aurantiacum]
MIKNNIRPLAGLSMIVTAIVVVALAIALFRGSFTSTVPVTVISDRAGLVMNPDAKVKMRDVQVGSVESITDIGDGRAALKLALEPSKMHLIPGNVGVTIASSTVFGAKFVELDAPAKPSAESLRPGQILQSDHVTVEINTVFEQLTNLLDSIKPEELNTTLSTLARGISGRGEQMGTTIADLDQLLSQLEPSLPNLSRDLSAAPTVFNTFADAAPDLLTIADNTSAVSRTVVDQQRNLDAFLVSTTGLMARGADVVGTNRQPLTDVLRMLVPTTDLLNRYRDALNCSLTTMLELLKNPPLDKPGAVVSTGFNLGLDRYRYPSNLPKVAATGGPQCLGLPNLPFETRIPFLVADTGANPFAYNNPGIVLNADGLKQFLFGPIDGPPRNSAQIGQPG